MLSRLTLIMLNFAQYNPVAPKPPYCQQRELLQEKEKVNDQIQGIIREIVYTDEKNDCKESPRSCNLSTVAYRTSYTRSRAREKGDWDQVKDDLQQIHTKLQKQIPCIANALTSASETNNWTQTKSLS